MASGEKTKMDAIGKAAGASANRHGRVVAVTVAVQVLARIVALSPLLLSKDSGGFLPAPLAWLLVAVLYIAGIIPLRFWGRERMRRFFYDCDSGEQGKKPYGKWLRVGLLRYSRGLLWGLPFLFCAAYLVIGYQQLDAKTFEAPLHWLATLLGGNVSLALVIIVTLVALFGLMFACGWLRDLAVEFLPVRSLKISRAFFWARRIRTQNKKDFRKNALVNLLLILPAIFGFGAVLVLYLTSAIDFSLGAKLVGTLALRVLRSPLPTLQIVELVGVFLVLYLPLCVLRKMRDAALIARLMRETPLSDGKESNAA